jgi:hypothetical protein
MKKNIDILPAVRKYTMALQSWAATSTLLYDKCNCPRRMGAGIVIYALKK